MLAGSYVRCKKNPAFCLSRRAEFLCIPALEMGGGEYSSEIEKGLNYRNRERAESFVRKRGNHTYVKYVALVFRQSFVPSLHFFVSHPFQFNPESSLYIIYPRNQPFGKLAQQRYLVFLSSLFFVTTKINVAS